MCNTDSNAETRIGRVKWFSPQRGYGFISGGEGFPDIFVHHTSIVMDGFRSLEAGETVAYERSQGRNGWEAVNVTHAPLRSV